MKITKEQVRIIEADGCTYIREWFPSVFEVKLEVGKWYKSEKGSVFNFQKTDSVYGFTQGSWLSENWTWPNADKKVKPATEKEVESALIAEAKKRGFKEGVYFNAISDNNDGRHLNCKLDVIQNYYAESNSLTVRTDENTWDTNQSNPYIFKDGVWATIIPTMTKEEAETKLGVKII